MDVVAPDTASRKSDVQQVHDLLSSRMPPQHVARFSQKEMQALASCVRDGLTMKTAPRESLEMALPGKPALVDAIVTAFQTPGFQRCSIWLRWGPKVHLFQLYNGYRLDLNGSSASVAAAWNWIPAPSSVVVGSTFLDIPVLQDGSVELPPHLIETSGMTEANPLLIEPRSSLNQLWCKLTAPFTSAATGQQTQ